MSINDAVRARLKNLSAGNKSWAKHTATPQQAYDLREDAKAIDAFLADHAKQAERIGEFDRAYADLEDQRQQWRARAESAEAQRDGLRKALDLIAMRGAGLVPLTGNTETATAYNGALVFAIDMGKVAREALSSIPASPRGDGVSAGEGWVTVPREPTEAMRGAGGYRASQDPGWTVADVWRDMIAASPTPPVSPEVEGVAEALKLGVDLLAWLAEHRRLELDYGYDDQLEDMFWRVHEASGSINDREWDLIGQGATPSAALLAAKSFLEASAALQQPPSPQGGNDE